MMRNKPHSKPPRRLVESSEFASFIKAARTGSFDERRLQQNRAALIRRLSNENKKRTKRYYFPLFPQRRLAWAALGALLLASVGTAAVVYFESFSPQPSKEEITDQNLSPAPSKKLKNKGNSDIITIQEPDKSHVVEEPKNQDVSDSSTDNNRGRAKRSVDSTLDEQVRLFNKAKKRLASGDHSAALEHLNRLKQRYPGGPLSLESKELAAHVLAGLHRHRQAAQTVKSLIRAKVSTRKKAQLYRFLGDLQVKQNLCDAAVESYRRALGLGLPGGESEAAKAGIRKCTP